MSILDRTIPYFLLSVVALVLVLGMCTLTASCVLLIERIAAKWGRK